MLDIIHKWIIYKKKKWCDEMQLAEQKEQLRILAALEQKSYVQRKAMEALRREMSSLTEKRTIIPPVRMRYGRGAMFKGGVAAVCCATAFISAGAGFFCAETRYKVFFWAAGLVMLWFGITFWGECQQEMGHAKAVYQAKMARHDLKVETEENRLAEEQQRKKQLQEWQETLRAAEKQTNTQKEEIYTRMQLPVQYRGYISVCMLYQYLVDGKCEALDGEDGAYHYYDNDSKILRELRSAEQEKTTLQQYQHVLYASLAEADQSLHEILKKIQNTAEAEDH